jgi:nucleoside-diphosphate-sugar epimerase
MITILGAGGAIGSEIIKELAGRDELVRLVRRSATSGSGRMETMAADLANPEDTIRAVSGSRVALLLIGLKYDLQTWRELWPRVMRNAIEAAKRAKARLIFFDNVYMYGKVDGPMTEETPFRPCSKKGEIRAEVATALLNEIKAGNLTAMIARSADFYGPNARTSVSNILVFDKLAKGQKPAWLVNDSAKHSFTYTPDASRSLVQLMDSESAWNQTWHVPTAPDPPTGKEFIALAAKEFGAPPKYTVLNRPMLKIAGWFDSNVRESYEMLYQNEFDYVFDSSKFAKAFGCEPTPYAEGIRGTAEAAALTSKPA